MEALEAPDVPVLGIWAFGSRQGKEERLVWCHVQLVLLNECGSRAMCSDAQCFLPVRYSTAIQEPYKL